jgi:hypothetical protein
MRGVVSLYSEFGMGHACPTTRGVFTAGHVVRYHPWDYNYGVKNFTWQDGWGSSGVAYGGTFRTDRDIGKVELEGRPLRPPYEIADPKVGEEVWWQDFSWEKDSWGMSVESSGKILHIIGDIIIFDTVPRAGASGGCLLNVWGKVVGIVVWGLPVEGDGTPNGAATVIPPGF